MDKIRLKEFINTQLDASGLSLDKLSKLTDVPLAILEALANEDFNSLPAEPYIRGYLKKIAEVFDIDYRKILDSFSASKADALDMGKGFVMASGKEDILPIHRFKLKTRLYFIVPAGLLIIFMIVGAYFAYKALYRTALIINEPQEVKLITDLPSIVISGETRPFDKVFINQSPASVDSSGLFKMDYQLEPGLNLIEIKSEGLFGESKKLIREIFYRPKELSAPSMPSVEWQQ